MEEKKRKKLSKPVVLLLILLGITAALCLTVLGLWIHGRNQLTKNESAPVMENEDGENHIISYNGKYYQYNDKMCNILLMGIDADDKPTEGKPEPRQADVLMLAALDLEADKMTLIAIPRDTMCDIEVIGEDGNSEGIAQAQLALSYAYGTTNRQCCELCRDAVSNIFHGLPIQSYAAFYMGGVAALNDAVGGVTVTVLDDYPFSNMPGCESMIAGQEMTLTGDQAQKYIRCRLEEQVDSNALRMQRQKQYLLSLITQMKLQMKEQPGQILSLYHTAIDYTITNLDIGRISYLATAAAQMDFTGDITMLEGDLTLDSGNHAQLALDQEALNELMISTFYHEVPAPAKNAE